MKPIQIPDHMVTIVPAAECLEKAAEMDEQASTCIDSIMRRWLLSEAAGWRKLAAERS